MAGVFICYRRDDSAGYAGRLYDALARRFGKDQVFMDVDNIPWGRDFVTTVQETLDASAVVLVLIGRRWLVEGDDGRSRLADVDDPVRQEVVGALARASIQTVPVLVDGATMPLASRLPPEVRALTRLNAAELRHSSWKIDVERLTGYLETGPLAAPRSLPSSPIPKPAAIETSKWQTYENLRFGFTIKYPETWPRSAEAGNGDGASLYVGNPDAQITAYGNLAPLNRQDPYELAKQPGFQRSVITMDNGREGDLIVGREDNQVVYQRVTVKGDVAYYFYAKTTEVFYRQNQEILLRVAKSLTPR
jgi:hypothetical protein